MIHYKIYFRQCCGSGMFILDPWSRIPDPGSNNSNKREGEKICYPPFFCSHKYQKIKKSCEVVKKKTWANFQRIVILFTQNKVNKLSKIWVWDRGSGKNLFRIQGQKGTGSRILDPQHWFQRFLYLRFVGCEIGKVQKLVIFPTLWSPMYVCVTMSSLRMQISPREPTSTSWPVLHKYRRAGLLVQCCQL